MIEEDKLHCKLRKCMWKTNKTVIVEGQRDKDQEIKRSLNNTLKWDQNIKIIKAYNIS